MGRIGNGIRGRQIPPRPVAGVHKDHPRLVTEHLEACKNSWTTYCSARQQGERTSAAKLSPPPPVTEMINGSPTLIWQTKSSFRTAILREVPEQQLILTCTMQASCSLLDMTFHNISRHSSTCSTATTLDIACLGEARMEACAGMCSKGWPSDVNQPTNSSISGQLSAGGFGPISHLVRRDLPNAGYKASENKDRRGRQPTASARQSHAKREKKKQLIAVGPATILSLQQQLPP